MGMAPLRLFHTVNDYVAALVGFCCTSFMIYLIRQSRNVELKKYNIIMLQSTFIDLALNMMNFLAKPIIVTNDHTLSIIINPIFDFGKDFDVALFITWVIALYFSICAVPISFIYRYRTLCQNKAFPTELHFGCLFVAGLFAITYAFHAFYAFVVRTQHFMNLSEELAPWFADNSGKVDATAFIGSFDSYLYFFMIHATVIIVICYSIIIFCSWKIYHFLMVHQQTSNIKSLVVEVQKQLTRTLVAQAVIPLFTFMIPVVLIILTSTLPIYISPGVSGFFGLVLTYIPIANALSMFFFVKSYRRRGKLMFMKLLQIFLGKSPSTSPALSQL
ncbi:hypothetical protein FO519_007685 [Halicephalobus sp. NKZ332]|nr:hypothetical protein FO519_007685 [Halicephalobus sp. NKZ332]